MVHVNVFDTTLRDGEQSPGVNLNQLEKIEIARQLERFGVDIMEAGFPASSQGDFESVRAIARSIKNASVTGLARATKADIDTSWEALQDAAEPRLHLFLATSPIHMKYKLMKSPEEVTELAVNMVSYARKKFPHVEWSAEDASRSDLDFLVRIIEKVIDAGATVINLPDTVGYATPEEYGRIFRYVKENVPNIDKVVLSAHCHDDLGMAVANTLAAIANGATQVEGTINGIGERAGNASLEEFAVALNIRKDKYPYTTNLVLNEIKRTSDLVSRFTGMPVAPNKAIIGKNAFAHESGIHQDGLLKEKRTYEIMTPESIGLSKSSLVIGKHSGSHAFLARATELGYKLSKDELKEAFERFKELADKKKEIYDEDIEAIITEVSFRVPDKYKLLNMNVMSGTVAIPTATVEMDVEGNVIKDVGFGDGPVDAAFKVIAKVTRTKSKLLKYAVNSITGGTDAQGEVTVRLEEDGCVVVGQGSHTDIIMASVLAYVNALNRLEHIKGRTVKKIYH